MPGYADAPLRGMTGTQAEKQATLTDKAIRVHDAAMRLANKLHAIHGRAIRPQPTIGKDAAPAPPCDHAVFAVEGAQQFLDEANKLADLILEAL